MADLASLTAQKDALVAALGRQVLRVTVDGQTVEYRSVAELRAALEETDRQIRAAEQAAGTKRRVRFIHSPGAKWL